MPTMEGDIAKYREASTVETVRASLEGAKYTLAVPKYVYDAGLKLRESCKARWQIQRPYLRHWAR